MSERGLELRSGQTPRGARARASLPVVGAAPVSQDRDLQAKLVDFASTIGDLTTPSEVLDALHSVVSTSLPLHILGAGRLPVRAADWSSFQLGRSVFLHKDAPKGWWEEYEALAENKFRPVLFLARSSLASYTWTEVMHMLEPIGLDRWWYGLALKHGMRDGFTCPVGGRWVVAFWSRKTLCRILTQPSRIAIFGAANVAALRLEQLAGVSASRIGSRPSLTAREIAVLRLVSTGGRTQDIARALGLGEETVRSHLKKAESKLGVSNRTHAACEALRRDLIP